MINLQIISGTDRPNSNAMCVSKYVRSRYNNNGIDAQIMDLKEFPVEQVAGGKYGKDIPAVEDFIAPLIEADGLIIVCPEYNGGFPGILKLFIDYLPFPGGMAKKPVAVIGESDGAFGAMRAVEQLQQILNYRNAHLFPERVFIPRVNQNFDEEQGILDEFQQELLDSQIENFPSFCTQLTIRLDEV